MVACELCSKPQRSIDRSKTQQCSMLLRSLSLIRIASVYHNPRCMMLGHTSLSTSCRAHRNHNVSLPATPSFFLPHTLPRRHKLSAVSHALGSSRAHDMHPCTNAGAGPFGPSQGHRHARYFIGAWVSRVCMQCVIPAWWGPEWGDKT